MNGSPLRVALLAVVALSAGALGSHGTHVTVDPQVVGDGAVVVESLDTGRDGFLVIHRDDGGRPGAAIGHTAVSKGLHDDLTVQVGSVPGEATKLWAVVHEDDGDGTFEAGTDEPVETATGVAGERFSAVGGTAPAYILTNDGTAQPSSGGVRLPAVASDREAFLVVHADDGGGPGAVIGRRSLSPGLHCDLRVGLNDSWLPDPGEYATPWAVLYADDGDGEFERGADDPVRVGGDPIRARVVLEVVGNASAVDAGGDCPPALPGDTGDSTLSGEADSFGAGVGIAVAAVALVAVAVEIRRRRRQG